MERAERERGREVFQQNVVAATIEHHWHSGTLGSERTHLPLKRS